MANMQHRTSVSLLVMEEGVDIVIFLGGGPVQSAGLVASRQEHAKTLFLRHNVFAGAKNRR